MRLHIHYYAILPPYLSIRPRLWAWFPGGGGRHKSKVFDTWSSTCNTFCSYFQHNTKTPDPHPEVAVEVVSDRLVLAGQEEEEEKRDAVNFFDSPDRCSPSNSYVARS